MPSPLIEPKFQSLCRLCNMYKDDHDTYRVASDQAMAGKSYGHIARVLKEYIVSNNLGIKPIGKKSIWTHFEKHMPLKAAAQLAVLRKEWMVPDGVPLNKSEDLQTAAKTQFDEYEELCALYKNFKDVHSQIYAYETSLKTTQNDGVEWSPSRVQMFVSMVNTQKTMLGEISKMRQGDKLITIASKFILEHYTINIINQLKSEFDTMISIMKRQAVDDSIIEAIEDLIKDRLPRIFAKEARNAMDLTKKEFKLPTAPGMH